jgi:predicted component of type VI protein secretion system
MTLAAAILILGISSLTLVDPGLMARSAPRPGTSANAAVAQEQTAQHPTPPETTKPSSAQSPSAQAPASNPKASTAKKVHSKKKGDPPAATCDPAPANSNTPGSTPATASPQPNGAQSSPATEAQKNCPPEKTIVRQGGITEQAIQLAGGSTDDQAQKRDAANQMIAATEQNLYKLTGRQLSNAERDSVIQIRQFVDQSRTALTAGNLERAQTLAWKAKLLSQDLIDPKK